jgi:hypothetical protein
MLPGHEFLRHSEDGSPALLLSQGSDHTVHAPDVDQVPGVLEHHHGAPRNHGKQGRNTKPGASCVNVRDPIDSHKKTV